MMKLDMAAIQELIAAAGLKSKYIRGQTRAVWTRVRCGECRARHSRKVSAGRNLTQAEGKDLYSARRSATVMFTIVALSRGKIHS